MVHGRSRREAWAAALDRGAGLPPGPCVVSDFSAEAGAAATRTLLDLADPPTAIVYANDLMAIAGLSVAASRGVAVPDQLSITGYEDTELAAHVQPPLTTVCSDVIGWGRAPRGACSSSSTSVPPPSSTSPLRPRRPRLHRPRAGPARTGPTPN